MTFPLIFCVALVDKSQGLKETLNAWLYFLSQLTALGESRHEVRRRILKDLSPTHLAQRVNTQTGVFHPLEPQPRPSVLPHETQRLVSCFGAHSNSPQGSTPDQTQRVKKDWLSSEPRSCCAHRPSLPAFAPPFPPLSDAEGATQPTIHSFSTKAEREGDVNSYRAGSFAFFANFPRD